MLECSLEGDTLRPCLGVLIADAPTNSVGKTTFTASKLGGHGRVTMTHRLANTFTQFGTTTVYLRSPDENGDGSVGLSDWAAFGYTYTNNQYRWWRDYDANQAVSFGDFTLFYFHYNHACPGGSPLMATTGLPGARVELRYLEEMSATATRTFYVDVSLVDIPAFSVACVGLLNDTPGLEFKRFEPGSFPGRMVVAPLVRNGTKDMAMGILGAPTPRTWVVSSMR
jgi:hypothetical protein